MDWSRSMNWKMINTYKVLDLKAERKRILYIQERRLEANVLRYIANKFLTKFHKIYVHIMPVKIANLERQPPRSC